MSGLPEWAQIKPGQRCLCPGENRTGCCHGWEPQEEYVQRGCPREAVRVIAVRRGNKRFPAKLIGVLPMCSACADYHEDAENARMTGQFDAPEES